MRVIITKNYEELSAKAARFILSQLWRNPRMVLGLPTGATPEGVYERLVRAHEAGQADFSSVTAFNLDEYWGIAPENESSYHRFMQRHLFSKVNIKQGNTHIPRGNVDDADAEGRRYERLISECGGIDLQLLGIGVNGHIGFNEPGTPFDSVTHLTKLSASTRTQNAKHFSGGVVPSHAITMGLATIMGAKQVLLLASGKQKAEAVAQTIEGHVRKEVPASILQWHQNATYIIDQDAASKLAKDYTSPLLFSEGSVELLTPADLPKKERIAVISPHPDDASISLGGIIYALSKKNRVYTVIMTEGYRSVVDGLSPQEVASMREKEARTEAKILGATPVFLRAKFYDAKNYDAAFQADVLALARQFKRIRPTMLFIPHEHDRHPTHVTSRDAALQALKLYWADALHPVTVWGYEGLWSLFSEEGDFQKVFGYGDDIMKMKLQAIASQKSQLRRTRFDIAAQSLARLRAAIVPEQSFVGYGATAPKLPKYFELFSVERSWGRL